MDCCCASASPNTVHKQRFLEGGSCFDVRMYVYTYIHVYTNVSYIRIESCPNEGVSRVGLFWKTSTSVTLYLKSWKFLDTELSHWRIVSDSLGTPHNSAR